MDQAPKIDKKLLASVVMHSKTIYLDRGNVAYERYLEPNEIIARAYVEAFVSVLKSQGYEIRKRETV